MKKTEWLILIATAAYSYLFYEQTDGINFLLFSILLTGLCLCRDIILFRQAAVAWLRLQVRLYPGLPFSVLAPCYLYMPIWLRFFCLLHLAIIATPRYLPHFFNSGLFA